MSAQTRHDPYAPRGLGRLLEATGAGLLAVLWIAPLAFAFWAAFHPPEFTMRFVLTRSSTWNIQWGLGMDRRLDLQGIADHMRASDPDVITRRRSLTICPISRGLGRRPVRHAGCFRFKTIFAYPGPSVKTPPDVVEKAAVAFMG